MLRMMCFCGHTSHQPVLRSDSQGVRAQWFYTQKGQKFAQDEPRGYRGRVPLVWYQRDAWPCLSRASASGP